MLDVLGLIPGIGIAFDIANAIWYFAEGDIFGGVCSLIGILPFVGDAIGLAGKGIKAADTAASITKALGHSGNFIMGTYVISNVIAANIQRYVIDKEEFSWKQLFVDAATVGLELVVMRNAAKGLGLDKVQIPTKVKGCVDLEALGLVSSKNQIPKSSRVESIIDVMKRGEMSADGKNIITQIDPNTKILFRLDAGDNAHSIEKYGYSDPVDHINIEIQTTSASGRSYTKWDYHIILDENGNAINTFETGPWSK